METDCCCQYKVDLDWLLNLVRKGGEFIENAFNKTDKNIQYKYSSADLLTDTDKLVEDFLKSSIQKEFPTHQFICEESYTSDQILTHNPTWIIDPVDGTMNFVHSYPFVAISIGLMCHKQHQIGVIFNPILKELYYATKNGGAWMQSFNALDNPLPRKITVASKKPLIQCLIGTGFTSSFLKKEAESVKGFTTTQTKLFSDHKETIKENTLNIVLHCRDIRRSGSCACDLAFVASGKLDAMTELGIKEWDICAGILLVMEAGGAVTNYDGTPLEDMSGRQIIAASSKETAVELSSILKGLKYSLKELEEIK